MDQQLLLDFDAEPERILRPDDIFEQADENLLQKLSENRYVERKSARYSCDKLGKMFACGQIPLPMAGVIILGMEDDGSFSGCANLNQKQVNNAEKAPHEYCPDALVKIRHVSVTNQFWKTRLCNLISCILPERICCQNKFKKSFVRRGDSKYYFARKKFANYKTTRAKSALNKRLRLVLSQRLR